MVKKRCKIEINAFVIHDIKFYLTNLKVSFHFVPEIQSEIQPSAGIRIIKIFWDQSYSNPTKKLGTTQIKPFWFRFKPRLHYVILSKSINRFPVSKFNPIHHPKSSQITFEHPGPGGQNPWVKASVTIVYKTTHTVCGVVRKVCIGLSL